MTYGSDTPPPAFRRFFVISVDVIYFDALFVRFNQGYTSPVIMRV